MAGIAVLAVQSAAVAHERIVRQIGYDFDTAACIGDTYTAVCMVETIIGCGERWESDLCDQAGIPKRKWLVGIDPRKYFTEYEIVSVQPVDAKLVSEGLGEEVSDWLGVWEVRVLSRRCKPGEACRFEFVRYSYYLKRNKDEWTFFRWAWGEDGSLECTSDDDVDSPRKRYMCDRYIFPDYDKKMMPWVHYEEGFEYR